MVTLGVDAHKRTHTIVAVDQRGRQLAVKTVGTNTKDHLGLLRWAEQVATKAGDSSGLLWAVEDCRHLSRRLERDLLAAGQSIVRVPPKLMAHVRDSARTYGKSDPIDALAVARAAQREPDLPVARLDGPDREVRLLTDHRESLVAERTRVICRLRWHLHELDPAWEPKTRSLDRISVLGQVEARIAGLEGTVARLARVLAGRCRELTAQINELTTELTALIAAQAPALIAIFGCGALTGAKILGETAGVDRFRSKDAYARHNGTAPLPVWSSNKAHHRLSRTGNRQLNAALHRIAMTQAHWHPPAKALMDRRKAGGDSGLEALRVLKRRLSDVVYAALQADLAAKQQPDPTSDSATAAA
jgi:transposase